MGRVDDGGQLVDVKGREVGVRGGGAAAGGGYLDEVGALLDELPDGCAALVDAGGLDAEVAEVAADDGDGASGEEESRAGGDAHLDGLSEEEGGAVLGAAVAHGGDAGVEVPAGVLGGLYGEYLVGQGDEVVALAPVADADEVDVGVNESGEDGRVRVVVRVDGRSLGGHDAVARANGDDSAVPGEHGAPVDGGSAGAVDESGRPSGGCIGRRGRWSLGPL